MSGKIPKTDSQRDEIIAAGRRRLKNHVVVQTAILVFPRFLTEIGIPRTLAAQDAVGLGEMLANQLESRGYFNL